MGETPAHESAPTEPAATTRSAPAAPELSIVIPAYNESRRLGKTLESIREYARKSGRACELLVVDDGSTDGTVDLVRRFIPGPLKVRVLTNPGNRGKGYSLRHGFAEAAGAAILMCDADQSTPVEEVEKLLHALSGGAAVAIGSRDLPDSVLSPPQPWHRRQMAHLFRWYRRRLLLPELRDTQCGFKLFAREAGRHLFAAAVEDGFAIDCEVLALARQLGYPIAELGVIWHNDPDSRVRPLRDGWRTAKAVWRIARRLKRQPAPVTVAQKVESAAR